MNAENKARLEQALKEIEESKARLKYYIREKAKDGITDEYRQDIMGRARKEFEVPRELLGKLSYSGDALFHEANMFKNSFAAYQLTQMRDARQMPSFVEYIRSEAGAVAGGRARKRDKSGVEKSSSAPVEQAKDAVLDCLREGFQFLVRTSLAFLKLVDELCRKVTSHSLLSAFSTMITGVLKELILKHSMFVNLQPPAVVKKDTPFEVQVESWLPAEIAPFKAMTVELGWKVVNEAEGRRRFDQLSKQEMPNFSEIPPCAQLELVEKRAGVQAGRKPYQKIEKPTYLKSCDYYFETTFIMKLVDLNDDERALHEGPQPADRKVDSTRANTPAIEETFECSSAAQRRYCFVFAVRMPDLQFGGHEANKVIFGNMQPSDLLVLSFPFCIQVHSSQHCAAAAASFWLRSFAPISDWFNFPPNADLVFVKPALEALFRNLTRSTSVRPHTEPLSEQHMAHIMNKLCHDVVPEASQNASVLPWKEFARFTKTSSPAPVGNRISDRSSVPPAGAAGRSSVPPQAAVPSFWHWFYKTTELIIKDQHLNRLWNEGSIIGFMNKELRARVLKNQLTNLHAPEVSSSGSGKQRKHKYTGVFGIFFSDSSNGAVSISWVNEKEEMKHVEPFDLSKLVKHGVIRYFAANTRPKPNTCYKLHPSTHNLELQELLDAFEKENSGEGTLPPGYEAAKLFMPERDPEDTSPNSGVNRLFSVDVLPEQALLLERAEELYKESTAPDAPLKDLGMDDEVLMDFDRDFFQNCLSPVLQMQGGQQQPSAFFTPPSNQQSAVSGPSSGEQPMFSAIAAPQHSFFTFPSSEQHSLFTPTQNQQPVFPSIAAPQPSVFTFTSSEQHSFYTQTQNQQHVLLAGVDGSARNGLVSADYVADAGCFQQSTFMDPESPNYGLHFNDSYK